MLENNADNEMINDPYTVGVQYVLFRTSVPFEEAIQRCKYKNMKLLALETQAEFNLITSTFTDTGIVCLVMLMCFLAKLLKVNECTPKIKTIQDYYMLHFRLAYRVLHVL